MNRSRKILIASGVLCLAIFVVDIVLPRAISASFAYFFVILLSIFIPRDRPTVIAGIIASALIVIGYFITELNSDVTKVPVNRVIALSSVWLVTGFVIWHKRFSSEILKMEIMFRVLFESAAEAIIITDLKGVIFKVNNVAEDLFAYEQDELIGQTIESLVPHDQREAHKEYQHKFTTQTRSRKMAVHQDLFAIRKNGCKFPVEVSLSAVDIGGEHYTMAIITDISVRKKMVELLKNEKEKAQQYLDVAGTMFVILDSHQKVQMVNLSTCEYLEYDEDEIIGKNWFDNFLPLYDQERTKSAFDKLINQSTVEGETFENDVVTKSGKKRTILWHNKVLKKGNESIGTLSSGIDVTEQRFAEKKLKDLNIELEKRVDERSKALKESQEMYKMIARNFPNGVINVLDKDLNYIFAEGMEMYRQGITSETLIGTSFLSRVKPEIRKEIEVQLLSVFSGESVDFELKTEGRTFLIYAVGLHSSNNEVDQILMVSQNVTGLKKAEEDTLHALEKERHLNELKSRFVSMASHEFRTPLTTALNSLNLLSKYIGMPDKRERQERHIERIKASVAHLTGTLNDFLSIDKLEEGKVTIHYTHFNLTQFVEDAIEDMGGMLKSGQQIIHNHEGITEVCLDKMMLKNIFNNLLSNAVKYSPEGSKVTIETTIKDELFTVVITDQGMGISEEDQKHLFERFFRANNALEIQGTGLGLNIIKKYTEMINGEISFESTLNEGSKFTVKLPIYYHNCEN
ncbi:MAG: PAS domain S-box-containing protein [Crocinitomicaceae bacterium]|jgi:PAS domain S-box-containing protein